MNNTSILSINYNGYHITTDKSLMIPGDVYEWLTKVSYWAKNIPYDTFFRSYENSFCIGALIDGKQVAYARLVTDYATFGYLADVYVLEAHRGKGISKVMMQELFALDWVQGLRRVMLATLDAHELYRQVGFNELATPGRMMEVVRPAIYGAIVDSRQ